MGNNEESFRIAQAETLSTLTSTYKKANAPQSMSPLKGCSAPKLVPRSFSSLPLSGHNSLRSFIDASRRDRSRFGRSHSISNNKDEAHQSEQRGSIPNRVQPHSNRKRSPSAKDFKEVAQERRLTRSLSPVPRAAIDENFRMLA